jgi:RNA polymerase sigma-70 factor (ECF subfamily)
MDEHELLAERFEAHRGHLRSVAYRMLGSAADADDAVQEAWLRMSRASAAQVENLGGWMTTIVGRVCLDQLRSRKSRGEEALGAHAPEPAAGRRHETTPDEDAALADAVGIAMLVVLDRLAPAERVAFVLHDMFDLSFDEIAPIVGRSPVATRQLASRARRRVRGIPAVPEADRRRQREVVEAFLAASRAGDLATLVACLDPDVVLRGDELAVKMGGSAELLGAAAVAERFKGQARAAVPGLIDGEVGVLVEIKGRMLLVLQIAFADDGRIAAIDAVANRDSLDRLVLERFGEGSA